MKWLNYISLFLLLFISSCRGPQISQVEGSYIEVKADNGIDSTLYFFLQDYKIELDAQMNQVISSTPEDLIRQQPSSNLGNMMTDIIYEYYSDKIEKIDFVVINQGGIRVPSISKGVITMRDAYQLMPFDNEIVKISISGKTVLQFVEHFIKLGGWPISQMKVTLDKDGNIKEVFIKDSPLDLNRDYVVATNDYVANGGDYCSFLTDIPQDKSGKLFREAIIEYWKKHSEGIQVDNEKRISYEER